MISLNKKTMKTVAAATVFAFGLSIVPTPAYAVSTNVVAETEGKNTLTLSQIQDLAVIYNDTVDSLELSIKQLENKEAMTRNQKSSAEYKLNSLYYTDKNYSEDKIYATIKVSSTCSNSSAVI